MSSHTSSHEPPSQRPLLGRPPALAASLWRPAPLPGNPSRGCPHRLLPHVPSGGLQSLDSPPPPRPTGHLRPFPGVLTQGFPRDSSFWRPPSHVGLPFPDPPGSAAHGPPAPSLPSVEPRRPPQAVLCAGAHCPSVQAEHGAEARLVSQAEVEVQRHSWGTEYWAETQRGD